MMRLCLLWIKRGALHVKKIISVVEQSFCSVLQPSRAAWRRSATDRPHRQATSSRQTWFIHKKCKRIRELWVTGSGQLSTEVSSSLSGLPCQCAGSPFGDRFCTYSRIDFDGFRFIFESALCQKAVRPCGLRVATASAALRPLHPSA